MIAPQSNARRNPQPDNPQGIIQMAHSNTASASELARLQRLEIGSPYLRANNRVPTPAAYGRIPKDLLNGDGFDIRSSGIITLGSTPATASTSGAFAYTSTTSSIHWYWDGTNGSQRILQRRADDSKFPIPAGDVNVTGLTINTPYSFYPFWPTFGQCQIGWSQISGTSVGTPAIAFAAANDEALHLQTLTDREPLSLGAMTAATAAAGSGSGSAGGGGLHCVMAGTSIEPVGDSPYRVEIHPHTDWIRLEAGTHVLSCTPNHPVYAEHCGRIMARDVQVGMEVLCDDGIRKITGWDSFQRTCTKRSVHLDYGHLFFANGFLSHNIKWG